MASGSGAVAGGEPALGRGGSAGSLLFWPEPKRAPPAVLGLRTGVEGVIEPKSRAGSRGVPLLAILRGYLVDHLDRCGRTGEDLAFGRTAAEAFYASTVDGRAKRAWKAANEWEHAAAERDEREADLLRPITMHHCRHTFASLLIDSGANPKAIQEFMGHSKIQTTFDVYGHLLPGSRDEVRRRMDAYLRQSDTQSPDLDR